MIPAFVVLKLIQECNYTRLEVVKYKKALEVANEKLKSRNTEEVVEKVEDDKKNETVKKDEENEGGKKLEADEVEA